MPEQDLLREDIQNPDLLYLGTEFAVFASVDRGGHWTKLNNNLPTVAVHEIAIHPTAGEIVTATHGRSLWVLDIMPLRQMTRDAINAKAFLYRPNTAVRWRREPTRGSLYGIGHRHFSGENPPGGAPIYYSLNQKASKAGIKILDYAGQTIRELPAATDPGLHRIAWDLNRVARGQGGQAPPGTYRVVLTVDGQEFSQPVRIEADPTLPGTIIAPEVEEKKDE